MDEQTEATGGKPQFVQIEYAHLDAIQKTLRDAQYSIRCFYPGANWNERKGMALLMEEMNTAEDMCLEIMRPILQRELHHPEPDSES